MKTITNPNVVCYDVDDTLVMWDASPADKTLLIDSRHFTAKVMPHARNIQALKESKSRGHFVIVWSAGGDDWARRAIVAAGLAEYVDLVITKPKWYCDDQPADSWMQRFYKEPV